MILIRTNLAQPRAEPRNVDLCQSIVDQQFAGCVVTQARVEIKVHDLLGVTQPFIEMCREHLTHSRRLSATKEQALWIVILTRRNDLFEGRHPDFQSPRSTDSSSSLSSASIFTVSTEQATAAGACRLCSVTLTGEL
jgi:hypothetical protein